MEHERDPCAANESIGSRIDYSTVLRTVQIGVSNPEGCKVGQRPGFSAALQKLVTQARLRLPHCSPAKPLFVRHK